MRVNLGRLTAALAIAGAAAFVLRDLLPGRLPATGDVAALYWPDALAYTRALGEGRIPLWDPLVRCGHPHLALGQTQVLYPPKLLHLLLPPVAAFVSLYFLHLVALGGGLLALARQLGASRPASLLAGLAGVLSPFVASVALYTNVFDALCLSPLPVALAIATRRSGSVAPAILTGLASVLVFLAGSPEIALATALAVGLAFLVGPRTASVARTAWLAGAAAGTFALVAAAQLLPFAEAVLLSTRARGVEAAAAQIWSLGFADLGRLFLPFAYGEAARPPSDEEFWATQHFFRSLYVGAPLLLLTVLGPWRQAGARLAIAGFAVTLGLLALGPATPLWTVARLLPGLGSVRYPVKFIALSLLAIPLLAALGADGVVAALARRGAPARSRLVTELGVAGLAAAAIAGLGTAAGLGALGTLSAAWAVAGVGLAAIVLRHLRGAALVLGALGLVACLDLGGVQLVRPTLAGVEAGPFLEEAALSRAVRPLLGHDRLVSWVPQSDYFDAPDRGRFWAEAKELGIDNRLTEDGIRSVTGDRQPQLDGLERLLARSPGVYRLLAARLHVARRDVPGLPRIAGLEGLRVNVYRDDATRGRAFVLPGGELLSREGVFARATAPGFDPYAGVLLEESPAAAAALEFVSRRHLGEGGGPAGRGPPGGTSAGSGAGAASGAETVAGAAAAPEPAAAPRFVRDEPEHVELELAGGAAGLLVLADAWAPGWEARVDGAAVPVLRAYGYVRAVPLTEGARRVVFSYRPLSFRLGVWLSALGLLVAVAGLLTSRRLPPRAAGASAGALPGAGPRS